MIPAIGSRWRCIAKSEEILVLRCVSPGDFPTDEGRGEHVVLFAESTGPIATPHVFTAGGFLLAHDRVIGAMSVASLVRRYVLVSEGVVPVRTLAEILDDAGSVVAALGACQHPRELRTEVEIGTWPYVLPLSGSELLSLYGGDVHLVAVCRACGGMLIEPRQELSGPEWVLPFFVRRMQEIAKRVQGELSAGEPPTREEVAAVMGAMPAETPSTACSFCEHERFRHDYPESAEPSCTCCRANTFRRGERLTAH